MTTTERERFLADRRRMIGASDAPALLGLSKWNTPLGVYLSKVDPQAVASEMTDEQRWGLLMEPVLHAEYERRYGVELHAPPTVRHPDYEYIGCSVDRRAYGHGIVELKTASQSSKDQWGEEETDEIPDVYNVQVHQQMAVTGEDHAYVFVAFWCEFRRYVVHRDDAIVSRILEVDRAFWNDHVLKGIPPEPDFAHASTADLLDRLHRPEPGRSITLDEAQSLLVMEYEALGDQANDLTDQRRAVKAQLIHALGAAEFGLLPDGRRLRRSMTTRKAYTVEESTFPTLRILNPPKTRS